MNQKGFANIVIIGVMFLIALGIGYFVSMRKTSTPAERQQLSFSTSLPTSLPSEKIIISTSQTTKPTQASILPDLLIESISSKRYMPPPPPPGSPQEVLGFPINTFEFTIKVKNIGDALFNQPFYLENTRSNYDLSMGHYSHGGIVNQQRTVLNFNETMEIKIIDSLDDNVNRARFLIATDGKPHLKDAYPKIEENNYNNNSYELWIR